jgi:hypothetical protein
MHSARDTVIGTANAFITISATQDTGLPVGMDMIAERLQREDVPLEIQCFSVFDYANDYAGLLEEVEAPPSARDGELPLEELLPVRLYARFVELIILPPVDPDTPLPAYDSPDAPDAMIARFYWLREHDGLFALRDLVDAEAEQGRALDAGLIAGLYAAIQTITQHRDVAATVVRTYVRLCGGLAAPAFGDIDMPDSADFAHAMLHLSAESFRKGLTANMAAPVWVLPRHAWHRADVLAQLARVLWKPGCVEDLLSAFAGIVDGARPDRDELVVFLRLATESEMLIFRTRDQDEHDELRHSLSEARASGDVAAEDEEPGHSLPVLLAELAFLGYAADGGLLGMREWAVDVHDAVLGQFDLVWLQWLALSEADLESHTADEQEMPAGLQLHFDDDAPYFLWPSRLLPVGDASALVELQPPERLTLPASEDIVLLAQVLREEAMGRTGRQGWHLAQAPARAESAELDDEEALQGYWHLVVSVPESSGLWPLDIRQIRLIVTDEHTVRFASFLSSAGRSWRQGDPMVAVALRDASSDTPDLDGFSALSPILPAWARPLCDAIIAALWRDIVHGISALQPEVHSTYSGAPLIALDWVALAERMPRSGLERLQALLSGVAA